MQLEKETLFLSKGEIRIINNIRLNNFSISNKEVLKAKYNNKSQKLTIKANHLGVSKISIWKSNIVKKITVYVNSKMEELRIAKWPIVFKHLGLDSLLINNEIYVSGNIESIDTYLEVINLIKKNNFINTSKLKVKKEVQKKVLSLVLYPLLTNGYRDVNCSFKKLYIECYYYAKHKINKELLNQLRRSLGINFIKIRSNSLSQYKVSLNIYSIESKKLEEIGKGIEKIEGLYRNISNISYFNNKILKLSNKNIVYKNIASPTIIVRKNVTSEIKIGSEIAYQKVEKQLSITKWKFTGLKLNIKINEIGEKLVLDYKSSFNRPSGNNGFLSGHKEKSSLYFKTNTPITMFKINFYQQNIEKQNIPYLKNIPLIRDLITSSFYAKTHKLIVGIILIEDQYE